MKIFTFICAAAVGILIVMGLTHNASGAPVTRCTSKAYIYCTKIPAKTPVKFTRPYVAPTHATR